MRYFKYVLALFVFVFINGCETDLPICDIVIQGGTIYDGSGENPFKGTVALQNDKIIYVGKPKIFKAAKIIDATGKAVAPGFINMLSWGYGSLLKDGRSLSDLKQGVTLEVFGEGTSAGPRGNHNDENYISFGDAMDTLIKSKVSTNVASFLGATTVRIQEIGYENRKATKEELKAMQAIVKEAMEEGAMGIGS
ncbi:D-aminoacylase, partial [bacterium AH-315-P13]|nr:D-aminoacylase [bacterium AH-315-P13]